MDGPQQVVLEEHHNDVHDETVPLVSNETQIQIQDNLYHQQEEHCCGYSLHYCSAFLNIGLWCAILFFIAMVAIVNTSATRSVLIDRLWLASYVALPVIYVIYVIEAIFSSTSKYLWNLNYAEDVTSFIYRLQHIAPAIWMECECYHYETRHRHVHKTVCSLTDLFYFVFSIRLYGSRFSCLALVLYLLCLISLFPILPGLFFFVSSHA
jgi:hypothetical protein